MICQHCKKNPATYNRVEIINGERYESHLCSECYAELYGELNSKSNAAIWASLFGEPAPEEKKCPVCGTSYSEYEKTGLLGCPNCYDVFREELLPVIQRIQGKTVHVGKAESNNDEYGLYRKLKDLQDQLESALKERKYGEAGRLNSKIREINAILFGKEGGDGEE